MRPYTGATDPAKSARAGTKRFQDLMVFLFGMKSLGIYANRPVRGGTGLSVHATGRACDLGGTPKQIKEAIDFLYGFRDRLEIEAIHDYKGYWIATRGFGAAYRCNRDVGGKLSGWRVYSKPTIGKGGQWTHYEISPTMASSPDRVDATFTAILNDIAKALEPK
jgi:hypothetical protein